MRYVLVGARLAVYRAELTQHRDPYTVVPFSTSSSTYLWCPQISVWISKVGWNRQGGVAREGGWWGDEVWRLYLYSFFSGKGGFVKTH